MKDLVSYLLDVYILLQSDAPKKKLLDLADLVIDYYRSIQSLIHIKSIFLWLDGLRLLVCRPTNPNRLKSASHSNNGNIKKESNEVSWIEEMPPTDSNCTKSKNHSNIFIKNRRNISNRMSVPESL